MVGFGDRYITPFTHSVRTAIAGIEMILPGRALDELITPGTAQAFSGRLVGLEFRLGHSGAIITKITLSVKRSRHGPAG